MVQVTRKQHFVPQFLLRNFAINESGCLHAYDARRNKLLPPMKPTNLLAQNFLYDRDNQVENVLANYVEAPAAPVIKKLLKRPNMVEPAELEHILRLVMVQLRRTPAALSAYVNHMRVGLDALMRRMVTLNGWNAEAMDDVELDFGDITPYLGFITLQAWYEWPLLVDLELRVLVNQTDTPFLISDHPAVSYNWYLRNHPVPMQCSPTVHGVQVFMPLSPHHMLCLNDASTYGLDGGSLGEIEVCDSADIEVLNDLQIRSCESFVISGSQKHAEAVRARCQGSETAGITTVHAGTTDSYGGEDGNECFLHYMWCRQTPLSRWLSFVNVRTEAIQAPQAGQHRDPRAVKVHEQFMKKLHGGGLAR